MGLYKRCEHTREQHPRCEHPWWYRFKICETEFRATTGTADRRRAESCERQARSYQEAKSPRGGRVEGVTISYLGGLDYERAEANGVTAKRLRDIKKEWVRICTHLGADSVASAITYESTTSMVAAQRVAGRKGQSIIRDLQALKRGALIAEELGALPFPPKMWPKVRRDPKSEKHKGKLHPMGVLRGWFDQLDGEVYDECRLIVLTGLRPEEAEKAAPGWREQFPELGAFIHVPGWAAKDRDERYIFLDAEADEIFVRCAEGKKHDAPLFSGADHKKARAGACTAIGYPVNITRRDLRATWSTIALQRTGDATAVMESMGHADLSTTQMYQRSTLERQAQTARAVAHEVGPSRHSKVGTELKEGGRWSQEWELNPRPADYESAPGLLAVVTACFYSLSTVTASPSLQVVAGGLRHSESAQQDDEAVAS